MGSSDAPLSPLNKEYFLAAQRGFYYGSVVSSVRIDTDQPRDGKNMHVFTEVQCPDHYHMLVTGAVDMERTIIGTTQYERRGRGPWKLSQVASGAPDLSRCRDLDEMKKRRPPDEAQIELYPGVYGDVQVTKGPIREYHGIKCQEYTVLMKDALPNTNCFAINGDPYTVAHARGNYSTVMYDFNKPIDIQPPVAASQSQKAR